MSESSPCWVPSANRIQHSNLMSFMSFLSTKGITLSDYAALHAWSIQHSDTFWQLWWQYAHVIGEQNPPIKLLGAPKRRLDQKAVPARDTLWFPECKLNYAENLLELPNMADDELAIIYQHESGEHLQITWQTLKQQVSCIQQWLISLDIKAGDIVAGYLPYSYHSVIAMLAATSLGAVWTSCSPDFGIDSVTERFGQVAPKALFTCAQYQFGGQHYDMQDKVSALQAKLGSLKGICLIDKALELDSSIPSTEWQTLLTTFSATNIHYYQASFNHPLFVLYSSGTTGKPKCIIHTVGGTLLNHLKEHQLHCDIKPSDRVFYFTTCGWMMWNWHVSALASGACLCIYDGSPTYPDINRLWQFTRQHSISLFGTSAKYLEALQKQQYHPNRHFALPALRTLCSTGSVLYPEQFDFVYQHIKQDLHLASISGGTDICGCFVLGNPISPVYRGECQGPALGMDVAAFDQQGVAITEHRGELVCRNSFPNQPSGFWHDDDGSRYHQAYWQRFSNTWHHGDDVMQTKTGGMRFFGRSDATLNPGGVRIGTGEIYRQVNQIAEITDCIAVGYPADNDEKIVLLVEMQQGKTLSIGKIEQIKRYIRIQCSPRHVPWQIHAVSSIPKTRSGKLVELAVKQLLQGHEIENLGAIANPEVLKEISAIGEAICAPPP
ncbi:acetoacetate--CoA ligase [Vibrio intestinalis]|uniref:acetoacetate--CoA ligase n=1 Tax=Vibrio intestinalis TaxID=2933291 RepID=UPI0021A2828B|nr:acetoacetate--CoA ligase [Vibrio intestinalis]